jgi:uncharacterized phage protein (TIGR01671 family)
VREIKFRGWFQGKMYYRTLHDQSWVADRDSVLPVVYSDDDKFEIMQYIGLKNSKGVEVFDGDIIKMEGVEPTEVFYSNPDFGYVVWIESMQAYMSMAFLNGYKNFEVIGNKFENPELITNNDDIGG